MRSVTRPLSRFYHSPRCAHESLSPRGEPEDSRGRPCIEIKTWRGAVFVPYDAIIRVRASGNYVTLFTESGEFLHRATMKSMQGLLPQADFARSHRSHLVRLTTIRSVRSGHYRGRVLELHGGGRVPLSRTHAAVRDWTLPMPDHASAPPTA